MINVLMPTNTKFPSLASAERIVKSGKMAANHLARRRQSKTMAAYWNETCRAGCRQRKRFCRSNRLKELDFPFSLGVNGPDNSATSRLSICLSKHRLWDRRERGIYSQRSTFSIKQSTLGCPIAKATSQKRFKILSPTRAASVTSQSFSGLRPVTTYIDHFTRLTVIISA